MSEYLPQGEAGEFQCGGEREDRERFRFDKTISIDSMQIIIGKYNECGFSVDFLHTPGGA